MLKQKEGGLIHMKARVLAVVAASIALVALAIPVFAHHSFSAEFDRNKRVSITGIITSVKWQNPHVYFYIDVKDKDTNKVTNYGIELGSPNGVLGNGLSRDILKVGMVVSLDGAMAKDGSNKLNGSNITVNGKRYDAASSEGLTP
jgi:Family of unknown function (DUF6152)